MKRLFIIIILFFVLLISFLFFSIMLDKSITLFLPDDYLFYECSPMALNLFPTTLALPSFILYFILYFLNKKKYDPLNLVDLFKKLGKLTIIPVLLWCFAFYFYMVNIYCVTEDKIIIRSTFDPIGTEYEYSDIEKIETGFGKKKISIFDYEKKGKFYYFIFIDGKKIVFHLPSSNIEIERYNDTYLELEEFDNALKKYNIPKESDPEGWENCDFDQRYVDRFLRIINSN